MFFCEFYAVSRNTFLIEQLWATASKSFKVFIFVSFLKKNQFSMKILHPEDDVAVEIWLRIFQTRFGICYLLLWNITLKSRIQFSGCSNGHWQLWPLINFWWEWQKIWWRFDVVAQISNAVCSTYSIFWWLNLSFKSINWLLPLKLMTVQKLV